MVRQSGGGVMEEWLCEESVQWRGRVCVLYETSGVRSV